MSDKEIEDPAHYVKLDVKKIEAVNGLQQLVQQNQLKADRAEIIKQKFEDLRATLASKLMSERRLHNETLELADQLKDDKEELQRLVKEAATDEEALELVKEDAEQAESEASLAREREQNLLLESAELIRLRDEYKRKIEEIEKEHFEGIAPLVARMKIEIKNAQATMAEELVKIEVASKEIQEVNEKYEHYSIECKALKQQKIQVLDKLENLDGIPEKYRKQCDIMINALQALQNQDGKWATKVKEVEAAVQSLYNTTKEKTEEHVKSVANMEKWRLGAEEKEQFEAEIQKELDAANLEIEEVLGDRVQLDMQMITKQSDLKHEVDILTNRLKERDRATMQEQEQETLVIKMQAQMPIFVQEKEKTQRELSLAELVTKKRKDGLEDIRKDIDILMNNFTVVENLSKEVARMQLETHRKVAMLEKHVVVCIDIEWKQSQHVNDLSNVYARLVQAAAKKQTQWREVKKSAELQVNFAKNFQKRLIELEKEYNEFIVLYNLVRGQRNKYARVMEASALTIAEMKDKLRTLNTEVEQLQGEVLYKVKVLNKMHVDYALSVKARTALRDEITKCASVVKDKKLVAEEYELEVINLENIIKKTEKDMVKAHKTYGLLVKDRNQVGISLIDRNDELCILYEKSNVQVELSRHSEVEIAKRMDEIAYLKRACNLTHTSIVTQHKTTPNPESVYMELASLKEQMEKACQDVSQLSDLMEKPSNLDRWRVLPGRDNTTQELTGKAVAIEEFLSAKEDQAYEKDLILEEVTTLAEDLMRKAAIARPESIRVGKQMNLYIRQMSMVTRQIMATVSELSLVQATAISMKQERESAQLNLDNASICLENGVPPTDDSERAWNSLLRQFALIHKTNSLRDAMQQVEGEVAQGNKKLRLNTTAEQRPNAYIAEHLGLPKPFGKNSPFRPSEHGSTIRHIRKPQLKAVEV